MLKTKLFICKEPGRFTTSNDLPYLSILEYQEFIEKNQQIDIISVNVLAKNHVLLTYKE